MGEVCKKGRRGEGIMFCDCCGVCFDKVTGRNIVDLGRFVEVCNPCKAELEEEGETEDEVP